MHLDPLSDAYFPYFSLFLLYFDRKRLENANKDKFDWPCVYKALVCWSKNTTAGYGLQILKKTSNSYL